MHVSEIAFRAVHVFNVIFASFVLVSPSLTFLGVPMVSFPKANLDSAANHISRVAVIVDKLYTQGARELW